MAWLIAALGTGLAIAGTLAIFFGAPYVQMEWGYAEVVAGTTALSAGIVTVALAAILFAIRDVRRLAAASGAVALFQRTGREDVAPREKEQAAATPPTRIEPVPATPNLGSPPPTPGSEGDRPDVGEPALFRPANSSLPEPDQAPTVVGRYEANGASYVLFSDGTIEVESETGTHRYASMQDLRDHIERDEPR